MVDVERLLEKYYDAIKHIETERYWCLGAYVVVVAGVLTFLAQNGDDRNFVYAYGVLVILSAIGFSHSWRAAGQVELNQVGIRKIVDLWTQDPHVIRPELIAKWKRPSMPGETPSILPFLPRRGRLRVFSSRWPPTFTMVSILLYVIAFAISASVMSKIALKGSDSDFRICMGLVIFIVVAFFVMPMIDRLTISSHNHSAD